VILLPSAPPGPVPSAMSSAPPTPPDPLDALAAAPDHHRLLFENDQVRILDTRVPSGQTVPLHTHRWPAAYYVLSCGHFTRRDQSGAVTLDSHALAALPRSGEAIWSAPLGPHTLENTSPAPIHMISVEIKPAPHPAPSPAPFPEPITLAAFESCSIPLGRWNHRAHLTVAYLLLQRHGLSPAGLAAATTAMCEGVQRYNAAHHIVQTPTGGYHHTLTIAWMRLVHATLGLDGPGGGDPSLPPSPDAFFDHHTQLASRVLLRLYYTRDRIMSHQARTTWLEPDLAPFPVVPPR